MRNNDNKTAYHKTQPSALRISLSSVAVVNSFTSRKTWIFSNKYTEHKPQKHNKPNLYLYTTMILQSTVRAHRPANSDSTKSFPFLVLFSSPAGSRPTTTSETAEHARDHPSSADRFVWLHSTVLWLNIELTLLYFLWIRFSLLFVKGKYTPMPNRLSRVRREALFALNSSLHHTRLALLYNK